MLRRPGTIIGTPAPPAPEGEATRRFESEALILPCRSLALPYVALAKEGRRRCFSNGWMDLIRFWTSDVKPSRLADRQPGDRVPRIAASDLEGEGPSEAPESRLGVMEEEI